MEKPNPTREKLLDIAEREMRTGGYHSVSFRDLADEMNIKSSSVHYHFRHKQDLGIAVIERYSAAFFADVEKRAASASNSKEYIKSFSQTYRAALMQSDNICLCGMLGAEIGGLPEPVGKVVTTFLKANVTWLENHLPSSLSTKQKTQHAHQIVSSLQGAMIMSKSLKDLKVFDDVQMAILMPTVLQSN